MKFFTLIVGLFISIAATANGPRTNDVKFSDDGQLLTYVLKSDTVKLVADLTQNDPWKYSIEIFNEQGELLKGSTLPKEDFFRLASLFNSGNKICLGIDTCEK